MKRVIVKTETRDEYGAVTSTHREEESQDSGLLEAWGFLALILASLLLTLLTYRVVSQIVASRPYTSPTESETYGIQRGQTEQSSAIARSERGQVARSNSRNDNGGGSGSATFTIDRTTLMDSVLPPGGQQFMEEISKGLGIDLLDPKGWSKEQVVNAKKLAAELDEKMMMMVELMPAVMKFLEFQVSVAEFHAEIMVEAYKAKHQIDKAKAKAFVAYYAYMRKAARLEQKVAQMQKHIDAAFTHFETVQDARSNAILVGLNQQSRLGETSISHQAELSTQRRDIRARNAERELRHELQTGHLTNQTA